jgi:biopolymer transport protein ExbB
MNLWNNSEIDLLLREKMKRCGLLLVILMLMPSIASAWWNADWGYKKKITLDMQKLKQDGVTVPASGFALIRLHTGNFPFFADLADKGKDIRVLAADEETPLKFYLEKLDVINEMALLWVKLPDDIATAAEPAFWLYYGNAKAVDAEDAKGVYDVNQVLSYPFASTGVKDFTAYGNNPSEATSTLSEGGLIGEAAVFNGSQIIRVPATPSLQMSPAAGWTVSSWVKIDQAQTNSVIFQRAGSAGNVTLSILGETLYVEVAEGSKQEIKAPVPLTTGAWHHLALTATTGNLTLYVDGLPVGSLGVATRDLTSNMTIGSDDLGARGFTGSLDQFSVFKVALDANAIKFNAQMQGPSFAGLTYGEDSTPDNEEGGESLIMGSIKNVTTDGWIIIGILGVMFVISWMVMIVKAIVLQRVHGENKKFEQAYSKLGTQDIAKLNKEGAEGDEDFDESPLLLSFTKTHGAFTGSTIYRIYHVGVEEMNRRLKKVDGSSSGEQVLSPQAMNAVRATMDAVVTRELQKLNSQMVLLTIAISGGPFLGLLGTVIGVMITFAAIAVSGEVNVNAIAPGIAGALTATVAGLIVAIPCLFGYNYLGGRIKVITADMHVFVDEFVAKLTEQHT